MSYLLYLIKFPIIIFKQTEVFSVQKQGKYISYIHVHKTQSMYILFIWHLPMINANIYQISS